MKTWKEHLKECSKEYQAQKSKHKKGGGAAKKKAAPKKPDPPVVKRRIRGKQTDPSRDVA